MSDYFSIFYDFNMSTKAILTVNFPLVKFRKIWQTDSEYFVYFEIIQTQNRRRSNKKKTLLQSYKTQIKILAYSGSA